jgi:hypothetical protein
MRARRGNGRMRVGGAFYFETEGIAADRSIAGESVTTNIEGVDIRIDFPDGPDAFSFPYATSAALPSGPGLTEQTERNQHRPPAALEDSGGSLITIRVLRIVTNADAPNSLRAARSSSAAMEEFEEVRARMRRVAQIAFRRLEEWLRIDKQQVWKPPPALEANQIGSDEILDLDRNESMGVMTFTSGQIRVIPQGSDLSSDDLGRFTEHLIEEPPLWARVLADAQYYTWTNEWAAPERAILLAALACELAAKEVLREMAEGSTRALLELLLEHPRDWSMAALALFGEPMKLIVGQSLREDNRALWNRLDTLFQQRNRVAHRGVRLDIREAQDLTTVAVEATEWLSARRAVRTGSGTTEKSP